MISTLYLLELMICFHAQMNVFWRYLKHTMPSSMITRALIQLLTFVSFPRHQIRAENDLQPFSNSSLPSTTSETAIDITNRSLIMDCAHLRAFFKCETFQEVEKMLNMTAESTLSDVRKQQYHLRIKRCNETERQNKILREFERRNKRKEIIASKWKKKFNTNKIGFRETIVRESNATQNYSSQSTNEDRSLADDLSRTVASSESTEPYLTIHRTLPEDPKLFNSDSLSTSVSSKVDIATTEQSSSVNFVEKLSKGFSQKNNISAESQTSEGSPLATVSYTKLIRKKNKSQLGLTKSQRNTEKRKKGPLQTLQEKLRLTMEGGPWKNATDSVKSSTDEFLDENLEYETVTPDATLALNLQSHIEQENLNAQQIHEDVKKQLQLKIEEVEKMKKKIREDIDRYTESIKNQVKISPSHLNETKDDKDIGKNIQNLTHRAANSELSKYSPDEPLHKMEFSSRGPTTTQHSQMMKDKPDKLFQTPSINLNTTPWDGTSSEESAIKVEHLHLDKRSTPQTFHISEIESHFANERASSQHLSEDEIAITHSPHHHEGMKQMLDSLERLRPKIATISQHLKSSEENTESLNDPSSKITISSSTNKDDVFSGLVGNSHQSNSNQIHSIHQHTTLPKSTTALILDKITSIVPFHKVEEWEKHITPKKVDLEGIPTHQPIHPHKDVHSKFTPMKKFHTDAHHHFHSSEISTSQPVHSSEMPLRGVTLPVKPYTEIHTVYHPVHQHSGVKTSQSHKVPNHQLATSSPKIIFEKFHEENNRTSQFQLIHSPPKLKHSNENLTPHHFPSVKTTLPTFHPTHTTETNLWRVISSTKPHTETHFAHQSIHHHPDMKIPQSDKISIHQPVSSTSKIMSEKFYEETNPTSQSQLIHSHAKSKHSNENFTPHLLHSTEAILPMKFHIGSDSAYPPTYHHTEVQKSEKISHFQPSYSTETFAREIPPFEKTQEKTKATVYPHHTKFEILDKISDSRPPNFSVEGQLKDFTQPIKLHGENPNIFKTHFHHPELKNSEKLSPLPPSHSTKINSIEKYSPQMFHEADQEPSTPHNWSNTDLKTIDTSVSAILENIKNLEKRKMEEIKKLHQKQHEVLHESHTHPPSHSHTFSTNLYPTHSTLPSSTSSDSEILEMPKPPLNPNDNWKYLEKLDKYYKKMRERSTTPQPPTIRPPLVIPTLRPTSKSTTPQPRIIHPPTTNAPKIRPTMPSPDKTPPNRKSSSFVGPTTTQKPSVPANYHINSTFNRTYNITINMVTPELLPLEDEREIEDEGEVDRSSNIPNEVYIGNEFDPITNMAHSTGPPKVTNEEPLRDFDSLPHASLSRELPSQFTSALDFLSIDQTTPLPSSSLKPVEIKKPISTFQSSRDDSAHSKLSNNEDILRSLITSTSKSPERSSTVATTHQKILHDQKNPKLKKLTDSPASSSDTPILDEKINLPILTPPISSAVNCTPGCNYVIVLPNKTEEVLQILNKNDQLPSTDSSTLLTAPKSAESNLKPDSSSSLSDLKSLLESIIQAKMTPSNKAELRNSINELLINFKQRRDNEYAKLYLTRLNPVVGDGRDSIVAINQINEYIELLQLMMVYLARDPDKLLDKSSDARIHNFESPYPRDDPQRRLIEDQFYYVHPKILNEFIDVYKKYNKDERYYGGPAWQFSQENEPMRSSRPRASGGIFRSLFDLKELIPIFVQRAAMNRPEAQYGDY